MKKLLFLLPCCSMQFTQTPSIINPRRPKIDALLAKMSLDEKTGQMTQVTLDVVLHTANGRATQPETIDADKIKTAIGKFIRVNASGMLNHWLLSL